MGADGGSFVYRSELVKTKKKPEVKNDEISRIAAWFYCALSKKLLKQPVVSCQLGKLYNKEAIVEFLLDKSVYGDGQKICGHIRSLKDVQQLKLTSNPSFNQVLSRDSDSMLSNAPFICPITLKEMNGKQRFVYLPKTGIVASDSGLKSMNKGSKTGQCPESGIEYHVDELITLNPPPEEEEAMKEQLYATRLKQADSKKSKKRKAAADQPEHTPKAKKADNIDDPPVSDVVKGARKAVSDALSNTSKNANQSDAVKSIFGPKDIPKSGRRTDSEWMTQGTWNRYAT
ncbi:hypothetical protein E3P89_01280 [Wallemia ichthyophaga]|uniref:Uncharacterized protein n=1 Tax=Wallemia ichthyophaga TaxID=245174 RepID=A0A4T0EG08_WALIC|nr:hypothetical protein E3P91_01533 [Wallemia ichthyophaga]TIB04150.1 hypothetical protein E3P94_00643 [Wallemia ichthyophaga]TIB13229.1 hypothetical protein E3P90_01680 [Wallemia ichthyophaga]TIB14993.1 hypothetical protein E3P93_01430 [Wallemia ichthyophaga]TIB23941.1 hypothetical protein E3P89_01280 [Wallemia ichthyophaga]